METRGPGAWARVLQRPVAFVLSLRRRHVFPGGPLVQAISVTRTGHLHPRDGLDRLVRRALRSRRFKQLRTPQSVGPVGSTPHRSMPLASR